VLLSCEALICSGILDFGSTYVTSRTHTILCREGHDIEEMTNSRKRAQEPTTNNINNNPLAGKLNTNCTVKNLNAMFAANRRPNIKYDQKDDEDDRDSSFISCFEHGNTKKPARRTRRS
jgi:hypothetical protein